MKILQSAPLIMTQFAAASLLMGACVVTILATGDNNNCSGVTNVRFYGNPCVKEEYYLANSPWNIWCTSGTLGVCEDHSNPAFDTTKCTYNPCTSSVGVPSNGGRPKSKTCPK